MKRNVTFTEQQLYAFLPDEAVASCEVGNNYCSNLYNNFPIIQELIDKFCTKSKIFRDLIHISIVRKVNPSGDALCHDAYRTWIIDR